MEEVVELNDYRKPIEPKQETHIYQNQTYILRYDPNAPLSTRWTYTIRYTVVYPYMGAEPTLAKANNAARRMIRKLLGDNERSNE